MRGSLLAIATSTLLVGCGGASAPPTAGDDASSASSELSGTASPPTTDDADATVEDPAATESPTDPQASREAKKSPEPQPSDGSEDSTPTTEDDATSGGDVVSPESEMPIAPEAPETDLSDLVAQQSPAPLVDSPLPQAANAVGRLVTQFPAALRPPARSSVESSSVSPSGDRLQVALVGSTSLRPQQVMRAYRLRLARRGMTELDAPASVGESQAAAFRRGRSRVTLTVSAEGARTTYSIYAVLHTGRE